MAKCFRIFEYVDSDENGTNDYSGWRLQQAPHFDPMMVPYGVVHDALEHHIPGEEGIEAEMMAFGAIYHIRVKGGWWNQFGTVNADKMVTLDIARFLIDRDFAIQPCPSEPTKSMNGFLIRCFNYYRDTLATVYKILPTSPEYVKALEAFYQAGAWLSRGHTRALKRWHNNSPMALAGLFNSVTAKVGAIVGKRGDKLTIAFDTKTLNHKVMHSSYM